MREYWIYFPFFVLHDWGKRSDEARMGKPSIAKLLITMITNKAAGE